MKKSKSPDQIVKVKCAKTRFMLGEGEVTCGMCGGRGFFKTSRKHAEQCGEQIIGEPKSAKPKTEKPQTLAEFLTFLRETLIPDLKESGSTCTAKDFETACNFMETYSDAARRSKKLLAEKDAKIKTLQKCLEQVAENEKQRSGGFVEPAHYKTALDVQDGCNLSGIVFAFAGVMHRICNEANRDGKGTDWKNQHPICVLFADKIAHLTKCDAPNVYSNAYTECRERGGK